LKIDCPKNKSKKKESKSEAIIIQGMVIILTHLLVHFLSPLLVVVQKNLSEIWIQVLPFMFVPNGSGLLVLKTRWRLGVV